MSLTATASHARPSDSFAARLAHTIAVLAAAVALHAGRSTVVTVGVGAAPIARAQRPVPEATQGPVRQELQLQP